jgi:lipopolysaccharide transport system ATP-binding protein
MSDTIIRVENLGKKYIIGHQQQERYTAMRDVIANGAKGLLNSFRNEKSKIKDTQEEFWALKDVSFEIKQGDRVGIIGRNGAGKSTLLKILSRITEPTKGSIKIKGRVASLLEVGTGFHPELTGRENIYLNGAILGMGKIEIQRKFDEIVDFAEVEKFLDTPVKRYSSGMYVKLAFAVAAHLEPEILIVDEVLAVGDTQFQKKCLGKMEDVGKEGRTVIFVSHQIATIESLCSRVIVVGSGQVRFDGSTKSGINYYLQDLETYVNSIQIQNIKRSGSGDLRIIDFSLEDTMGNKLTSVSCGEDITLVFGYELLTNKNINNVNIGFSIHTISGTILSILYSEYVNQTFSALSEKGQFKCTIRDFPYSIGRYMLKVRVVANGIEIDWPQDYIGYIDVESGDFYHTGSNGHNGIAPVMIRGDWNVEFIEKYKSIS